MTKILCGSWKGGSCEKTQICFVGSESFLLFSGVQEEGDGGRAPAEQDGDDAAEQPAAGGRAETSGAVTRAGGLEGNKTLLNGEGIR